MPFGLVDDQLHSHVKWRRATKGARALWTTALSWCSSHPSDGFVPADMLRALEGTRAEAECLVKVGLWNVAPDGWVFHEWSQRNPDAASVKAKRKKQSDGGKEGNHLRWHVKQRVVDEDCKWCSGASVDRSGKRVGNRIGGESPRSPTPITSEPMSTSGTPVARDDEPPQLETSVPRHVLPPGWAPGNTHKAYAGERGIDLGHELRQFRLHCKSKRTTSLDWDAEFERWLGNARIPGSGGSAKGGTSDRVHAHADLARRLAAEESNVIDFPQLTEGGS